MDRVNLHLKLCASATHYMTGSNGPLWIIVHIVATDILSPSFHFSEFHLAHFSESFDVGEKDAEIDGIGRHANDAKVVQDEVKNVSEPQSAAVGEYRSEQLKLVSTTAFHIAAK